MKTSSIICWTALPWLLCAPALAQDAQPVPPVESRPFEPLAEGEVGFSADRLIYDEPADRVTATGDVRMRREGYNLRADTVSWNRVSGEVTAEGNVRIVSPEGDIAYGDRVALEDTLRDGVVENLLLVLEDGGRLAANRGTRENGVTTLDRAAYSPCAVVDENGCPKDPTWQINAVRVIHDPARRRITYQGASLNLFGVPIIALPGLSHPDGTQGGGTGFLVPELRYDRQNGLEIQAPYYIRLAPNRDITVTPHIYTEVLPMVEGEYRHLLTRGAYQLRGYLTYGTRTQLDQFLGEAGARDRGFRAYLEGNGRFQLTPAWSITAAGRYVTDRTFLRRYDISLDDRLRSVVNAERITSDSYLSVAGWAFQGLRLSDVPGQQPIALPAIDFRWRPGQVLGGVVELQANSLSILRTEGQDTQRAFVAARWDRRMITGLGQELTLTAFARADAYHANDTLLTQTASYRGKEGWSGRAIGALAADLRWPFVGPFLDGTQRFTPRVQLVLSPNVENLDIPNEDARSVDLEDSNLFSLNRFPGYDRWEDSPRITYGADWAFDLRRISVRTNIGQSYRLDERPAILPPGTGLSDRFSDFVGRTSIRFGNLVDLVHRFRLDKDNFAVRRNEVDATVGSSATYLTFGYLRLNRDIDRSIEDLRDREELRIGGRVAFARYWSVFGSAVVDLTNREEDPLSLSDGFDPVRHRLGILYDDDCIELGLTWRRDYEDQVDVRRGNTFLIRVALKNLGR